MKAAIGLDIGHSAVKLAVSNSSGQRHLALIPTAVCQAFRISEEMEAERAAKETVRVESTDYFIGETAVVQGGVNVIRGMSENWVSTPEYTALMIGAYRKAREFIDEEQPTLVLGLPTHLYLRQKEMLREKATSILGVSSVRVIPQPIGPYFEAVLDEKGIPASGVSEKFWGIIEIGHFTTDFALMKNGRWVEKASGICSGSRVAAEYLQRLLGEKGFTIDLLGCDDILHKRYIRNFNERIDVSREVDEAVGMLTAEVIDTATKLIEPYARELDGVIVAGGGAGLAFEKIRARWPNAICPSSPRYSVAEGMRRFAAMLNVKGELA